MMIRIPQEDLTFIRVLGRGGCGKVHLAESKTFGMVAVKKTHLGGEEQTLQEFLYEAELLSKMQSPYIIRFFGTSRIKECECVVMEYAPNGTLFHFLELIRKRNSESSFLWDKRYQIAQDITRGLLLMHSHCLLHRDMNGMNILLDKNMTAKISDIGYSKIKTKNQTTYSSIYEQNNVFGSLLWKAPETFSIRNPYTSQNSAHDGMSTVLRGERLDIPSTCPVEFKELIEHCWHKEPKHRPTASIVFEIISQILGQIPKCDSENITSSVPQLSGSDPDRVITIQEVPFNNLILSGSIPNRLLTDNQSVQSN